MDKITFESVMEEIKKSLGEARLKSIEEVWGVDTAKPLNILIVLNQRIIMISHLPLRLVRQCLLHRHPRQLLRLHRHPLQLQQVLRLLLRLVQAVTASAPRPSLPSMAAQGPKLGASTFQGSNTPEKPNTTDVKSALGDTGC
jgi:hypothetical protein